MRHLLLTLLLPLLLLSCATPAHIPTTSANPFGGAAGTQLAVPLARLGPGRKPAFGPYKVTEVRRGWITTRTREGGSLRPGTTGSPVLDILNLPYAQRVSIADSKMQFHFGTEAADGQQSADVYCSRQAVTESVVAKAPLLGRLDEELRSRTTETFNAIVVGPKIGETNAWDLLLTSTNRTGFEADNPTPVIGLVGDADQVLLQLRLVARAPLPATAGKMARMISPLSGPGGVEVLHQNQRIAYLDYETLNPDYSTSIWIRDGLDPQLRFLTMTTIATLFMQSGDL